MTETATAATEAATPADTPAAPTPTLPAEPLSQPAPREPAAPTQPAAEAPDDTTESHNAEAARWRTKLRAAEAERDALAERLAGYQRRECEAAIANLLEVPADLWDLGGADHAAFYGEDGSLDAGAVRAAAEALIAQRPRLARPEVHTPNLWGQNGATPPGPSAAGWDTVIKGR